MKAETFLSAYGISCVRKGMEISKYGYTRKFMRLVRQASAFRARLLSMYSGDFLRFIEISRNYWRDRAYLVEQENRDLRERLEELENAWAVDETIQPDGSLRPSLTNTVKRAAKLEAENARLRERLEGGRDG